MPQQEEPAGKGTQMGARQGLSPRTQALVPAGSLPSCPDSHAQYLLLTEAVAVLVCPSIISFRDH